MDIDDTSVVVEESEELLAATPSLLSAPAAEALHTILVNGGQRFDQLAGSWRTALGDAAFDAPDEPPTQSPRDRLALLQMLASQAQA
eukprot:861975-Prymnesium_polylepis.1